jgi:hypothetical protein
MDNIVNENIARLEKLLSVCEKELEYLMNPQKYGCCVCRCNTIVVNKQRGLTIKTGKNNAAEFEFSAAYPTHYSPKTAKWIVENVVLRDGLGNRVVLETMGDREYYQYLKEKVESTLKLAKTLAA